MMGFQAQAEFQKALKRLLRNFSEKLGTLSDEVEKRRSETANYVFGTPSASVTDESVLGVVNGRLSSIGIPEIVTYGEIRNAISELKSKVEKDGLAKELAVAERIRDSVQELNVSDGIGPAVKLFLTKLNEFAEARNNSLSFLLMDLYQKASAVLNDAEFQQLSTKDHCPLCDQRYDGKLIDHVQAKLNALTILKQLIDQSESARFAALELVLEMERKFTKIHALEQDRAVVSLGEVDAFAKAIVESRNVLSELKQRLQITTQRVKDADHGRLERSIEDFISAGKNLIVHRVSAAAALYSRLQALSSDEPRRRLVEAYRFVDRGMELYDQLKRAREEEASAVNTSAKLTNIVNNFVKESIADVQLRFDAISSNVARYFAILENSTPDVEKPSLTLLADEDRAVILQIQFLQKPIANAYTYLSISQLNSFGLAVFLASVRFLNTDFKFLILDDIVNSFDAYKRPQVASLLKDEFGDFQILLLTHDQYWADNLVRSFPSWNHLRFAGFNRLSGAIEERNISSVGEIQSEIDRVNAPMAGAALGPMMELRLQEICESCQAQVTYNRKNEYTLATLIAQVRARLHDKLGEDHAAVLAISQMEEHQAFRNYCSHWKNPASPITAHEVQTVLNLWKVFEATLLCPKCSCYVTYADSSKSFKCSCGILSLTKQVVAQGGSAG